MIQRLAVREFSGAYRSGTVGLSRRHRRHCTARCSEGHSGVVRKEHLDLIGWLLTNEYTDQHNIPVVRTSMNQGKALRNQHTGYGLRGPCRDGYSARGSWSRPHSYSTFSNLSPPISISFSRDRFPPIAS